MVAGMLLHGQESREFYELFAYVVMPNHVHLLIMPIQPVYGHHAVAERFHGAPGEFNAASDGEAFLAG